ncbi:MAG: TrmB family transcriptional regulator [Lachnospiraceae bacterium]|nr:TrmB family transcriptional regulator [Lachnospiraceae bacterium]
MIFGLTRQEATIYICLYQNGAMNGYETAKLTGISRSNVYSALAGLVEKGAAYLMEGTSNKYLALPVEELCENYVRHITEAKEYLEKNLVQNKQGTEGYITIEGYQHIQDKICSMLSKVEHRLYLSLSSCDVPQYLAQLERLASEGKKVVLLTDAKPDCSKQIQVYVSDTKEKQIHLIVDSAYVLTGDYSGSETDTCLYSGQKNFVNVLKDALRNEIRLSELGYEKRDEN